jgi:flagellar basal body rod protein FlgB
MYNGRSAIEKKCILNETMLRFILLDSIQTLIPNNNNIDINIDLLLYGNRSFSYDLNTEIFQAVHKFIIDTHRFI